jgi:hypothetical protein
VNVKAVFVWNGDKGSSYAFSKVREDFDISYILMVLNGDGSNHSSLSSLRRECEKLGVPFFWAKLKSERPEEYLEVVAELKDDYGIEAVVTDGSQGVIEESCGALGVRVIRA